MFIKKVDLRSRKKMTEFLSGHYRYDVSNSWNRMTSFANNVKLYNLDIPKELMDRAYEIVCSDIDTFEYDSLVDTLISDFYKDTGYTALFNGRSGGYIVLYDAEKETLQYKSYCLKCGQKNYKAVLSDDDRCGCCGAKRINITTPITRIHPKYAQVGSQYIEDYEDMDISELREMTKLVQRFDRLCNDIREEFLYMLQNSTIVESEYTVTKVKKEVMYA